MIDLIWAFLPHNFWECVGWLVGLFVLYCVYFKYYNKHAERNYTYVECMYCHRDIVPMDLKVLGRKGWGHVECVELRSSRRRRHNFL